MTYKVLRGISVKKGDGWKDWFEGDKLTDSDAPANAIKDWLKIGAIKEVK